MKKILSFTAAILASALVASAIPAKRGFRTLEQPDGTTIEVELVGDETVHFYRTPDGQILMPGDDGVLRYAFTNASGKVELSAEKAVDAASKRSAEISRRLSAVDRESLVDAIAGRAAGSGKMRARRNLPAQSGLGLFTGNYPRKGKVHGIVFLVEYRDIKFNVANPREYFTRMLNEEGFSDHNGTGSARDYFLDQSNGQFDVTFDVYGPVTLSQNRSYYGANDNYGEDIRAEYMVTEGAQLLDSEIDFSQYDYDNDGKVDNIFVLYAGQGEADYGPASSVWPHSWDLPAGQQITLDGKRIVGYACANEWGSNNIPTGIGTVCHEFSHVMGLPDLYATNGQQLTCTPGYWNIMDYGSYNNDGRTPPCYSAFERNAMGWIDPMVLEGPETVSLEAIGESNTACLIPTEQKNEFFLLENRQQTGWDKYLPHHGMLIWHIDFNQSVWDSNSPNNNSRHQYVDIEEANSNPNNESMTAMRGYPFPGTSNKTSFTSTTTPALKSWANKGINLPVTNIKEANGVITFDVDGGNVVLDTPAAPTLAASDDGKLAVSWTAVPFADEYLLDVYTRDGDTRIAFGDYKALSVGNVTKHTVEGLSGETDYYVTVTARKGRNTSEPSAEAMATMPKVDIQYVAPMAVSALLEGGNATFSWMPVKDAVKYLVTVEVPVAGASDTDEFDFGSGDKLTVPAGWSWNGTTGDIYGSRSTQYFGESAPALKFQNTGAALTSPVYGGRVSEVSFWLRGASPSGSSTFSVEGRGSEAEGWNTLRDIVLVNEAKTASTFTVKPSGDVRQIRFIYSKVAGNAALDDVKVSFDSTNFGSTEATTRLDAGNATSYTMPLAHNDAYFYVEAVDASGRYSKPSNKVRLNGSTAIGDVEVAPADAAVEYFNLQGMRVTNPGTGLYIRRQGNKVEKVFVK